MNSFFNKIKKVLNKLMTNKEDENKVPDEIIKQQSVINDEETDDQQIAFYSLSSDVGKKIIYISNEWQDPQFGIGVEVVYFANTPDRYMLKCKNVLDGMDDFYVFYNNYILTDEILTYRILQLDPFTRWNIRGKASPNIWHKTYNNNNVITDPFDLEIKLREVGFMFKDIYTLEWLLNTMKFSNALDLSYHVNEADGIISVSTKEENLTKRLQWLTFSNNNELEEFKRIVGIKKDKE